MYGRRSLKPSLVIPPIPPYRQRAKMSTKEGEMGNEQGVVNRDNERTDENTEGAKPTEVDKPKRTTYTVEDPMEGPSSALYGEQEKSQLYESAVKIKRTIKEHKILEKNLKKKLLIETLRETERQLNKLDDDNESSDSDDWDDMAEETVNTDKLFSDAMYKKPSVKIPTKKQPMAKPRTIPQEEPLSGRSDFSGDRSRRSSLESSRYYEAVSYTHLTLPTIYSV